MRKTLMTSTLLAASAFLAPAVFANTNSGAKLFIATVAQNSDLDQAGFEGLVWVQVTSVGSVGETGINTNILTYDTWDTDVIQKGKGISDAGSPEIEVARIADDPGQVILRAGALTNLNYAFKIERNDAPNVGGTPTILYNRGLITGPKRSNGRNEDFDLEMFTFALQQREVVADPVAA